jgi:hypothetical protein
LSASRGPMPRSISAWKSSCAEAPSVCPDYLLPAKRRGLPSGSPRQSALSRQPCRGFNPGYSALPLLRFLAFQ